MSTSIKTAAILTLWTITSLWFTLLFESLTWNIRPDSFASVFVGFSLVVFGCYVVGRYTNFGPLYLFYGGVCALLWVPFYSPYASFIGRNSNGTWLAYIGLAFTLMICCRLAARFGYNAYHDVDCNGHVQIEEQSRTMA